MNDIKDTWYCVFNPTAGTRKSKDVWLEIEKGFNHHKIAFASYFTKCHGDAVEVVISKIKEGYRKFAAAGGDGTVHEIVNAFLKQDIISTGELTLAVIPVGTGNDWAKHHDISSNIDDAVSLIKRGQIDYQDIGLAKYKIDDIEQQEYFNNVAGLAYDAFVVQKLEQKKSKPNKLIYIFSVLLYLFQYKLQNALLTIDKTQHKGRFYTVNVGICKYSGGGMSLVPHAIHNDGLFAVTYAKEISKLQILLNTYRFYNETLTEHPKINGVQGKEISIDSLDDNPVFLELDGESVGHTPVSFSIIKSALRFIK